jgi:putative transposase
MPTSWSQILLHVVFSTKHRLPQIPDQTRPDLHAFIGGIVRQQRGALLAAGGMPDHIHLLIRIGTDRSVGDLLREVKARSSRWMRQQSLSGFRWQAGYGAFSVSRSQEAAIRRYIDAQPEHHRKRDFKQEFLALLRAHGVEVDERFIFD